MKKIIAYIFGLFLSSFCHAQEMTEDQMCGNLKSDSYGYFISNAQLVINRDFNVAELSKIMEAAEVVEQKEYTMGFTSANWNPSFTYKLKAFKRADGTMCAVPDVDLSLELRELVMFIAKDVKQGSCVDKAVRDHELRHVELYRKSGDLMVQNLNNGLRNVLDGVIFDGQDSKELFFKIDDFILNYLKSAFEKEMKQSSEEHEKQIDTKDEQETQSNMCAGAAQKILKKY
jgi:hypothetical protein